MSMNANFMNIRLLKEREKTLTHLLTQLCSITCKVKIILTKKRYKS